MKTGYHAVYEKDFYEGIDNAKNSGFEFVQFDLGVPRFFLDNLSNEELFRIKDYAVRKNIIITFHAPGDNVSLFCDYSQIRKGIIDQFKMILEKANILGARHITFHTGHYPKFKKVEEYEDEFSTEYKKYYEDVLYRNIKELIQCSGNVLVCFENCNLNTLKINVLKKLIDEKNDLYLTLDIPKIFSKNFEINGEVFDFMMDYKESIRELHIHDANEKFGTHQVVGSGVVDFTVYKDLFYKKEIFMNFEVRPFKAAIESKENLKVILKR